MKTNWIVLIVALGWTVAFNILAKDEQQTAVAAAAAVDSAEAVAAYPLTTCVVSGDTLGEGDMGPPINYVYKEEGKPDRLVRFCCKSCIRDFKKDPATYLKKIDDAAAAK